MRENSMTKSNVVRLQDVCEKKALENLNRLTGLEFESFPVSLVNNTDTAAEVCESEIGPVTAIKCLDAG